jgi:hypothetical protein
MWRYGLNSSGLWQRPEEGFCERVNKAPGSKKSWEGPGWLNNLRVLNEGLAPSNLLDIIISC